MKIVYIAAAKCLPHAKLANFVGSIAKDVMGTEPIDGYFLAAQLITAKETNYASEAEDYKADCLVNFARYFDEIWLVGPEGFSEQDFDQEFRIEMRCVNTDRKPVRRWQLKADAKP